MSLEYPTDGKRAGKAKKPTTDSDEITLSSVNVTLADLHDHQLIDSVLPDYSSFLQETNFPKSKPHAFKNTAADKDVTALQVSPLMTGSREIGVVTTEAVQQYIPQTVKFEDYLNGGRLGAYSRAVAIGNA